MSYFGMKRIVCFASLWVCLSNLYAVNGASGCNTIDDINGEDCDFSQFTNNELTQLCDRMQIDITEALALKEVMKDYIFPGGVDNRSDVGVEGDEDGFAIENYGGNYTREEIVDAALVCHQIAKMEKDDFESLAKEFQELLVTDRGIIDQSIKEMRMEFPDVYAFYQEELKANGGDIPTALAKAMLKMQDEDLEELVNYDSVLQILRESDQYLINEVEAELRESSPEIYNSVMQNPDGRDRLELLAEATILSNLAFIEDGMMDESFYDQNDEEYEDYLKYENNNRRDDFKYEL